MIKKLDNKVALVTGGLNGIGESIAELFIENGAKVIVVDLHKHNKVKPAKIKNNIEYLDYDVSIESNWKKFLEYVRCNFNGLNVLVNNVGINGIEFNQDPENMKLETWNKIYNTNLTSIFFGCKYAIKLMKENNEDYSIINISSRSALLGVPNLSAYASSKAAIINYTKSVALYCAQKEYRIRCNTIVPAAIESSMWSHISKDRKRMELYTKSLPLKRMGTTKEVANAALYLASNDSLYTTASEIIIDGGVLSLGIGIPK